MQVPHKTVAMTATDPRSRALGKGEKTTREREMGERVGESRRERGGTQRELRMGGGSEVVAVDANGDGNGKPMRHSL